MFLRSLASSALAVSFTLGTARAADPLDAFPPADEGMVRFVIDLPEREDADQLRVELIPGKQVETDPVNRHFFAGQLGSKTVEGMGYSYYILPEFGPMAGTLMAPPPGAEPEPRFVALGGEPFLIRYNDRLPIVVYLPQGAELRYRIWETTTESQVAEQG